MKIITMLNHKGGVGKTTLAYHTGTALAARGWKVLGVDGDGQGSLTIEAGKEKEPCFYDAFVRQANFSDVIRVVDPAKYLPPKRYHHQYNIKDSGFFWLIPGNAETMNVDPLLNSRDVRDRLLDLQDDVDVVIVDTSPTPSKLHAGIYLATDLIMYPTELEYLSTDGLLESIRYTDIAQGYRLEFGIKQIEMLGIVPNKFRQTTVNHTENLIKLQERFGSLVWEPISLATAWPDASVLKKPVFAHEPNGRAAVECWNMVERIEEVLKNV